MGLAQALLGETNPFGQWTSSNRNTLLGLSSGFLSGDLGNVPLHAMAGRQADDLLAEKTKKAADEQKRIADAATWLESMGQTELAGLTKTLGDPAQAVSLWSAIQKGEVDPTKGIEINGQLVNPITGQLMGDFRSPDDGLGDAPSGYRWGADGSSQEFIPGGPADPASKGTDLTQAEQRNRQLSSVIEPELATVEANWDALANVADQGNASNPITFGLSSPEYQQASNALETIIASYLYSVSGATATNEEVSRQKAMLMPHPFESESSKQQKKARVRQMAEAVKSAAGGVSAGGGAADPLGIR